MAVIEIQNVTKSYGSVKALDDVSLDIHDQEFLVLFGPAGAGKTTLLKVIAGLIRPDDGDILFDSKEMSDVSPADRNTAMVFENYALYPHKTAYDNIASPLRSKRHRRDEETIREKVNAITKIMKIDHLLERRPVAMSNGQRQRVALGRCLIRDPAIFLMDEPLAHLDAKLRHLMRAEMKEMQAELKTTTLYVTHDYLEALSLGDRVVVINEGRIVQIGTGRELYYAPTNEFVAKLIGEPEINMLSGDVVAQNGSVRLQLSDHPSSFVLPPDVAHELAKRRLDTVRVGLRGVNIRYAHMAEGDGWVDATVRLIEPIGNKSVMLTDFADREIRVIVPNDIPYKEGDKIGLQMDMGQAMFFDPSSERLVARSGYSGGEE